MPSDQELLKDICRRDHHVFEEFLARYHEPIRQYLVGIVRDNNLADDIAQDVFLRVWQCCRQYDGSGSVRVWLFRIARNLALNSIRSRRRRRETPFRPPPLDDQDEQEMQSVPSWMVDNSSLGPDAWAEHGEFRQQLQGLIEDLPDEKREVLHLLMEGQMDVTQIARQLDVPTGTVKSRLHYARKQLAEKLKT